MKILIFVKVRISKSEFFEKICFTSFYEMMYEYLADLLNVIYRNDLERNRDITRVLYCIRSNDPHMMMCRKLYIVYIYL